MSREKAFTKAALLSKEEKSEVVVFLGNFGYGVSFLSEYDGSVLNIHAVFSDGYVIENH